MRRATRDASPSLTQNRFAVLSQTESYNTGEDEADDDVQMYDACSDIQSPVLAPIPCSLPTIAASRARAHAY